MNALRVSSVTATDIGGWRKVPSCDVSATKPSRPMARARYPRLRSRERSQPRTVIAASRTKPAAVSYCRAGRTVVMGTTTVFAESTGTRLQRCVSLVSALSWARSDPVFERGVHRAGRSHVLRFGTHQAVAVVLLEHVGSPAGHPAEGEDRGEDEPLQPQHLVGAGGVEVDVGVKALDLENHLLDLLRHLEPLGLAGALAELLAELLEHRGPRVIDLVYAMPEAHHPLLLVQRLPDPFFGTIDAADLLQHLHDRGVGAAVKRSLERPDRPHHRGVHVRQGAGDDPSGKG